MLPAFPAPLLEAAENAVTEPPQTLHARFFLLAYDLRRGRLDGTDRWRFGLALRNPIGGRPAKQRPLAVELIGALGELPTVFGFDEAARHYSGLKGLVDRGVAPVVGMRRVIDAVHAAMWSNDSGP